MTHGKVPAFRIETSMDLRDRALSLRWLADNIRDEERAQTIRWWADDLCSRAAELEANQALFDAACTEACDQVLANDVPPDERTAQ